jgi:3',5'-cyclic AMP phosphodiesterase CpdA
VILFTGDAVGSGAGQGEWDTFFDRGEALLPYVPLVFAHGNHEANAVNFYSLFALPGNEEFFGLDYGPFHLTVLNDSPTSAASIAGGQKAFFEADVAAHADAPWRLLMHHRSQWSASSGHGGSTTLQNAWGPVVDSGRVQLVFSGHDHMYERSKPLRAKQVAQDPAQGTVYVVTGGGGAPLYGAGSAWHTAFSESRRHYLLLSVRAGQLEGRAYREDRSLLDSFTLIQP